MVLQIGNSASHATSALILATAVVANSQGPHVEANPERQTDERTIVSIVPGTFARFVEIPAPPQGSWNPLHLFARRNVASYGIENWSLEGLIMKVQEKLGLCEIEYRFERTNRLDELAAKHAHRHNLERYVKELLKVARDYASRPQIAFLAKIGWYKLPDGVNFEPGQTEKGLYLYTAMGIYEQAVAICENVGLKNYEIWRDMGSILSLLRTTAEVIDEHKKPCPAKSN